MILYARISKIKNMGFGKMNKDFKNLGISFAISSLVDGLSLQKLSMPALNRYVYLIKSKDGKIDYVVDIEKDSNNLDTDEVLRNILTYTQEKLSDDNKPLDFSSREAEKESIALVLNLLKSKANEIYNKWRSYTDTKERKLSPEQKQLDELSNTLFNISETFYDDCEVQSNEFDVIEYMLSTLDIVYGEGELDPRVLNQPIEPEKLTDIYKKFSEDIYAMKEYDGMITDVLNLSDQLTDQLYNKIMGNKDNADPDEDYDDENENYDDEDYDDEDIDMNDAYESLDYNDDNEDDTAKIENIMSGILSFLNNVFGDNKDNEKNQDNHSIHNDDIQDEDDGKDDLTKE